MSEMRFEYFSTLTAQSIAECLVLEFVCGKEVLSDNFGGKMKHNDRGIQKYISKRGERYVQWVALLYGNDAKSTFFL